MPEKQIVLMVRSPRRRELVVTRSEQITSSKCLMVAMLVPIMERRLNSTHSVHVTEVEQLEGLVSTTAMVLAIARQVH